MTESPSSRDPDLRLPRIGIFLAYWPWISLDEQLELAVLADRSGIDSLWVAETWGQESVSMLGWLAAKTERIALCSGLMQIPARKPTTAAMAAATLDVLSGGRVRLGLGVSGPQVSEGWYGEAFGRPLTRTREYVDVVRRALAGEEIALPVTGEDATGMGKPLKLLAKPVQKRIPIYLGALGPKAIDQCYRIADGWLPFVVGTEMLSERPRPERPFDVSPILPLAVHADVDVARDAIRPWLSFYFGAMGTVKKHFLIELAEANGHGDNAREVQRRYLSGDRRGAAAALDDALIDASAVATTPERLAERLAEYRRAGADSIVAVVLGDRIAATEALAALSS